MTRKGIIKRKGDWQGVVVTEDETMHCPRYVGLDGKTIVIVVTEVGSILAVKENEVYWGK